MSYAHCENEKGNGYLKSNEVLEVVVTDKGALNDIPAWAKSGGHTILNQKEEEGVYYFYIQKNNKISE